MIATSLRQTLLLSAVLSLAATASARADIVGRESDVTNLRLGQKIYVDDGSCPAGQIKEVAGMRLTAAGVEASRKCVDRKGKR
jgi:catabolite regulation protein CreA